MMHEINSSLVRRRHCGVAALDCHPFPRLKLARCPHSLAPTLVASPSISVIPFLDSWGLKAWPLLSLPAVVGIRCS